MKVHTHLRFFLLPACTLAVLLLAGCGGGTAPAGPASQLPGGGSATGEYPPVPQLGEGLIEVKMRPQEVVEFGGGGPIARGVSAAFELPSALQSMLPPSKAASFDVFDLRKDGSAYDPALPYNRVMPDSNFAVFSPNWGPAGQNTLSDVAYSTYMFPLQDFGASTQEQTVGVQWDPGNSPDSFFDVFLGFGNIGKDTWDWYMGPDDGVVTVDSFLPYENANGDVLIVLAVLDTKEVRLNSLTVGELEIRGLGDGAPPLFTDVQFIPDFWKIAFPTSEVDLSPGCSPINDQGGMGSCTAFGVVDSAFNYELLQIYDVFGWDFSNTNNLTSPRYVYVQTGIDLGGTCPSGGRNTWDIAQWVIDNGTSTEMNAPYGSRSASLFNCTADWTIPAVQDAQVLKINTRTWIASVHPTSGKWHLNDADIDDVKTVLREQERVVPFRTQVDFDFSDPDYANGEAWTYDGNNRGGHAMCIVGYNDSIGATGAFKVRNSWGLNWGDDGYCWISYESMKHSTAGVYAFYITADCDVDVISRFCPTTPFLFPVCGIRIPILYPEYILLTWEPVVNAVRYVIYRDLQVEPWGFVTAPEPGMPVEFMDEQVGDYLAHVYWVVATDGNVDSEFSSPVVGWLLNGT